MALRHHRVEPSGSGRPHIPFGCSGCPQRHPRAVGLKRRRRWAEIRVWLVAQDSPLPEALPPAAHVARISGDLPGLLSIEADAPQRQDRFLSRQWSRCARIAAWRRTAMPIHALHSSTHTDPVAEARVHLAAALRMAVLHELDEGIDNHFTVEVPGRSGQYLILPFGRHWSE